MPKHPPAAASFEQALDELDTIVRAMEEGKLPLDHALDQYQRGVALVRYCQSTLDEAEQKVKVLEGSLPRDFTPGERNAGS